MSQATDMSFEQQDTKRINVLVVEDEELVLINMVRALTGDSRVKRVVTAGDGVDALRLLRAGEIERERLLVLVDLRMPRMGGMELIAALRADPLLTRLPVVVVSTSAQRADLEQAFGLFAAGCLLKPAQLNDLRELVENLLSYWSRAEFPTP